MTHSTINVVIGHETYPVHVLEGQEALSVPFYFKVDFLASLEVETLPQMLLTRAKLHFLQDNVMVREVIGVISEIRVLGYYNDDQIYFQLKLQSKLALLEHSGGINHFPAIDLKNCAFQVVKKHGINEKNLVWISQNDREKTNYFQMDTENDLEFVTRVLTEKSIYFYSVFKDEEELMCFCHDHFHEGYRSLNISKAPTLDNNAELNHIKVFHRLVHNRVLVRSHKPLVANEIQQEEKERRKKKPFKKEYFGYEKIKSYAAIEENKEFYIKVFGNLMDLKLNDRVMLAADVCNNKYDGTYHVVSLKHVAKQPTGIQGQGKPAYYHVEVKLLPDHCLFQKTKSLNGMLSLYAAKIVGEDKEKADLNENGHYKIRYLFDRENKIVFNVPRLTTF
ncbi:MAG: contractile injection system protein, VgrG/Pvc8 family, partial [Gammaproteobacteria bacterium]